MATLEGQEMLSLVERANSICFFDLECTGLNGDYNSILIGSIRPFHGKITTFTTEKPGDDALVCALIRDELERYDMWVSFYGKGFDIPMLEARLLVNGLDSINRKLHLDLFWLLRYKIKTSRKSQAHLLSLLGTPEQKMSIGANEWNQYVAGDQRVIKRMIQRCESDVRGLKALYTKVRHLVGDVTR